MRKHELRFTVHLDDYHSNITAWWPTIQGCVNHVQGEIDNGYDVDRITVDGKPLFCTRTLRTGERAGQPCGHPVSEPTGAHPLTGLCITHEHQDAYDAASAAGRYQGD